jgi:hypothetical protein
VWDMAVEVFDDSTIHQLIESASNPPKDSSEHQVQISIAAHVPAMEVSPRDFRPRSPGHAHFNNGVQPMAEHVDPAYGNYTGMAMLEHMEGLPRDFDEGDRLSRSYHGISSSGVATPPGGDRTPNWRNRLSLDTIRRPRPKRARVSSTDDALLFLRGARKPASNTRWSSDAGQEDGENIDHVTKEVVVEVRACSLPVSLSPPT